MAQKNNVDETNMNAPHNHLEPPEYDTKHHSTIYKLTLSMKRRFCPQVGSQTPSPEGAGEVKDLLRRLVEIDNESRELLGKVFSLLEKDESLETYVKRRIEDPKVSRMWQLVEQVLACQECDANNLNEVIMGDDNNSTNYVNNYSTSKGIIESDEMEEEIRNERFKVRNISSGNQLGCPSSTTT